MAVFAPHRYLPISNYGVIGNLRTVALVGLNGSVDWCCFPELDGPSVFGGLLDLQRGGRFRIAPVDEFESSQRYWPETNILETAFQTNRGRLIVTDWMPLAGSIDGCGKSRTEPVVYRKLECAGEGVEVSLTWAPRFDYARVKTEIRRVRGGFLARGADGDRLSLAGMLGDAVIVADGHGPCVGARFQVSASSPVLVATRWSAEDAELDVAAGLSSLQTTADVWRDWVRKAETERIRDWLPHSELVIRSELALRLLIHGDTGAIAAAGTTSLPEDIGGVRNWDYRFTWIRDSSQLIESFMALGHHAEVLDFLNFIEAVNRHRDGPLKIMYGLRGELDSPEQTLDHLEGYRHSRPVRIGNRGFEQSQHDVYGEILNSAYELARLGHSQCPEMKSFLVRVANEACDQWRKPDYGIWEMPDPARHHVYSKTMVWVALDRAVQLAERFGLHGDVLRWERERDLVRAAILRDGYSEEVGAFVLAFGSQKVDGANLMMPMMEFLPFEDPRIQGTINRTIERLAENNLVYRYRMDDVMEGEEGAFGLVTFWLADALALSGRLDEAQEYFESMISHANHLGLFSEQVDPWSNKLLGNFPQAFTHFGLIDTAIHLAYVQSDKVPIDAPIGSVEHRQEAGRIARPRRWRRTWAV